MVEVPGDHRRGGIRGLRRLLSEHAEAIEADLQQFYGIALSDLAAGRLTWRRFGVLVRQLPSESRTAVIQRASAPARRVPLEEMEWTLTDHLIATVADHIGHASFKKYQPIRRPGANCGRRIGGSRRSTAEVRAYLDRFKPPKAVSDDHRI